MIPAENSSKRQDDSQAQQALVQRKLWIAIAVGICVELALMRLTDGNAAVAVAPFLAIIVGAIIWRMPMRWLAHGLLFLALWIDNPTERPGRNLYHSFSYIPGQFLYETMSKSAHIPIKFTGLQLIILFFLAMIAVRTTFGDKVDGRYRIPASKPMVNACFVSIGALFWLLIYGMGRGGALNYAIVQMQTMLFMPIMTLFFAYAFKSRKDIKILLRTYIVVGVLRAFQCVYYWATVVRHQAGDMAGGEQGDGSYVTTHSDSILATIVIIICVATIYQSPRWQSFFFSALIVPPIGIGIVLNNRRIAFVAVAFGFAFSYLAANPPFRRRVHQTIYTLTPIALLYLAAGWNAHGGWAKPVQSLRSVIEQKDTSSATRDIENYNLLLTLKQAPIAGSGFGHKYVEREHAYDISKIFEAYRYIPHNSILWFWSVGGVVGETLFWIFICTGVFLSARVSRYAEDNNQRLLAMTALTAVIAHSMQCYGDMGLMSWMGSLLVSSSMGAVASMATKTGAWGDIPSQPRMTNRRSTYAVDMAQSSAVSAGDMR